MNTGQSPKLHEKSLVTLLPVPPLWCIALPAIFLLGLNSAALNHQLNHYSLEQLWRAPGSDALLVINGALALGMYVVRTCILRPWRSLVHTVENAARDITADAYLPVRTGSVSALATEVIRLTNIARENYARCIAMGQELEAARNAIARHAHAQQTVIGSTRREMTAQYQNVLAYAHYLEERIDQRNTSDELRQDFDDVCESSLNLKLISSALALLDRAPLITPITIATTMQQMMLALAPSLQRRNMKLSTAEVDLAVTAKTDAGIFSHALWMMLLGIVRYAENESTLRMRALYDHDKQHTLVSIVVSELAAGKLSNDERGHYLERQLKDMNPHMFADTIRLHANIQLAELLLQPTEGRIEVVALNAHACEICLFLPAA